MKTTLLILLCLFLYLICKVNSFILRVKGREKGCICSVVVWLCQVAFDYNEIFIFKTWDNLFFWKGPISIYDSNDIQENVFWTKITVCVWIRWCKIGLLFHISNFVWMLEVRTIWGWRRMVFVVLWNCFLLRSRNQKLRKMSTNSNEKKRCMCTLKGRESRIV